MDYKSEINSDDVAEELVEQMRADTDLSYWVCRETTLNSVRILQSHYRLPQLQSVITSLQKDTLQVESCVDSKRMSSYLSTLSEICSDSQQRSWALHEDLDTIVTSLEGLRNLIKKADERVAKFSLSLNDYRHLYDLVNLYQMETRLAVRNELLKTFKEVLSLSPTLVSVLLPTVLPVELARDLLSDRSDPDSAKTLLSLDTLTLLLCTGEIPPYQHYDYLNEEFVLFLLNRIEAAEELCQSTDAIGPFRFSHIRLIVAFNLHLVCPENSVINCLSEANASGLALKAFAEDLLILANKNVDPVWPYGNVERPNTPNSVIKILQDIFSTVDTATIFYSTDLSVLFSMVLREISDLSPGKLRSEYLSLLHLMLLNGDETVKQSQMEEIRNLVEFIEENLDENSPDVDCFTLGEIKRFLLTLID